MLPPPSTPARRSTPRSLGSATSRSSTFTFPSGLRRNGGFTKTHALKESSEALNHGSKAKPGSADPTACEKRDQRGVKRPQGRRCDIGAFERE